MTLSARGKRLLEILQHGPACSQELIRAMQTNYPPRAASELDTWLRRHAERGTLVRDRECLAHKNCIRYRLLKPEPVQGTLPRSPSLNRSDD